MAQKVDSLYVEIDAKLDGLEKGMKKADSKMKAFGSGVKKLGVGILGIGAVAATAGTALLAIGNEFDKATRTIRVGTGATGDALKQLEKDFESVFARVPDDAATVADALATLNTATGSTGKVLQGLTESVLDVSRLLGEDASANAQKFGQVMNQFNVPAEKGTELLDNLFKITQDYGISLNGLNSKLATYGSVMDNAGFSVEETALLMGKMHKAGLDWSRVAPGLNKSFRDMAKAGIDGKMGLEKAVDAIRDATSETDALAISTEIFGAEGAQRMMKAIRDNVFTLDDLEGALGNNKGLIEKTEQSSRTLGEEFSQVTNELKLMIKPLAMDLVRGLKSALPAFKSLFDYLRIGIRWLVDFGKHAYDMALRASVAFADIKRDVVDMYMGIKTYLVDKFVGIVDSVKEKVESVKNFFRDMYIAVVGNSYVPDMVEKINQYMDAKLKKALVTPTEKHTEATTEAFDDMANNIGDLLGDILVEGESFTESFQRMIKGLAKEFIAAFTKMAIKKALFDKQMAGSVISGSAATTAAGSAAISGAGLGIGGPFAIAAGLNLLIGNMAAKDQRENEKVAGYRDFRKKLADVRKGFLENIDSVSLSEITDLNTTVDNLASQIRADKDIDAETKDKYFGGFFANLDRYKIDPNQSGLARYQQLETSSPNEFLKQSGMRDLFFEDLAKVQNAFKSYSAGSISRVELDAFKPLRDGLLGRAQSLGISTQEHIIPQFAKGGIVTAPTLGMIGEGGESEAVIPLSRLDSMMGGKSQTIIINLDGQRIAQTTVRHMPEILTIQGVPGF